MNTKFLILLTLVLLNAQTALAGKTKTACIEWKTQLGEIVNLDKLGLSEIELKPKQKFSALVSQITKYPNDEHYDISHLKVANKKEAVERILQSETCFMLTHYDLMKSAIKSPQLKDKDRKEAVKAYLNSIVDYGDSSPNLITLLIQGDVIARAIEAKVIKVSEEAYFNLGSIRNQIDVASSRMKILSGEGTFDCIDLKTASTEKCKSESIEKMYNQIAEEYGLARPALRNLIWWIKRVR